MNEIQPITPPNYEDAALPVNPYKPLFTYLLSIGCSLNLDELREVVDIVRRDFPDNKDY